MASVHTKFLLTEGSDDLHSVVNLMKSHVKWGESSRDWPVEIKAEKGVDKLLEGEQFNLLMKTSGLEAVGILVDADDSVASRWGRIRGMCSSAFGDLPDVLPPEGLIHQGEAGVRLGVWRMPDNQIEGMLETFLLCLAHKGSSKVRDFAFETANKARSLGAPFSQQHIDKAVIHTWLAWQERPGQPFGIALKAEWLDPKSTTARPFVDWFVKLFQLEELLLSPRT